MKRVNCKTEKYDVYIGRGSKWGNPYSHLPNCQAPYPVDSREDAVRAFEAYVLEKPEFIEEIKKELRGKILGCYCYPVDICHGDILLKIANE